MSCTPKRGLAALPASVVAQTHFIVSLSPRHRGQHPGWEDDPPAPVDASKTENFMKIKHL